MLKTELVLTAEEELLDRDRTLEADQVTHLKASFERLKQLRDQMGRTAFCALKQLLPFSANDEWELEELRELID